MGPDRKAVPGRAAVLLRSTEAVHVSRLIFVMLSIYVQELELQVKSDLQAKSINVYAL